MARWNSICHVAKMLLNCYISSVDGNNRPAKPRIDTRVFFQFLGGVSVRFQLQAPMAVRRRAPSYSSIHDPLPGVIYGQTP